MLHSRDLQLVAALARGGSMRSAAAAMGVHLSTVFRRLGQLEAQLGVRLFERFRDGYQPTAAGVELHALAQRLEDDLRDAESRLRGRDLKPSGLLRVTTTDTLFSTVLPEILVDFRASHPEVELEIAVSNQPFDLIRRDADVAIRPTAEPPQNVVGRRLATLGFAVYAAPAALRTGKGGSVDLADQTWIGYERSLAHIRPARWLAGFLPQAPAVRVNTLLGAMHAARAGLGCAALPCYVGDREPALVRIAGPLPDLASGLWLLTHPDMRRVARVKVFMDFVAKAVQARAACFEGRERPPVRMAAEPRKRKASSMRGGRR